MRRKLFALCSALSVLLCVATAVFWARSYVVLDAIVRERLAHPAGDVREERCVLARGRLTVSVTQLRRDDGRPADGGRHPGWLLYRARYPAGVGSPSPGPWFARWTAHPDQTMTAWGPGGSRSLVVNLPVVIALAAACPIAWLVRHLRQGRRRRQGMCVSCGYDLRATRERCPECGAVPRGSAHNPPMHRTATASSGAVE